jgi:uncharacterized protein (DUF1684 family)
MTNKEYEDHVLEWRAKRYDALVRENGWLALAGLYWLKEGRNLIGSNPLCEISLPENAPTFLGVVEKKGRTVHFQAPEGVPVEINGRQAGKTVLKSTQDPHPSFITWNRIRMVLHEHAGRYAIRVWDNARAERFSLPPLNWFPVNNDFRFHARYTAYAESKASAQPDVFGDTVEDRLDGCLSFTHEGKKYKLDVTKVKGDKLYLKFKDLTSGQETYPASRYLYTPPFEDGKVILDFNYAYSPPCAFTPYATCLFAPAQNHLPFRVEAGEIYKG